MMKLSIKDFSFLALSVIVFSAIAWTGCSKVFKLLSLSDEQRIANDLGLMDLAPVDYSCFALALAAASAYAMTGRVNGATICRWAWWSTALFWVVRNFVSDIVRGAMSFTDLWYVGPLLFLCYFAGLYAGNIRPMTEKR
jgi:hypothetical protein